MNLPVLDVADAQFVTQSLLVGGDLDARSDELAAHQLVDLVTVGVTHIVDVRDEWSDEEWVRDASPHLGYLHHGVDDAGQRIPGEWFEAGVRYVTEAVGAGGTVLVHCHMGINRGPSLAYGVLLRWGWDCVAALDAIRSARAIAFVAYAEDALAWHHAQDPGRLAEDLVRVARWREENHLDVAAVIRLKRSQELRR